MAGSLRPALTRLEHALTADAAVAELRQLGDPAFLELLFRVELATLVRLGPAAAERPSPRRLLAAAQQAAARGVLPASAPAELRGTLSTLESELREAGAWAAESPLWWQPLPAPSLHERLWGALDGGGELAPRLPPREALAAAFGGGRRWLTLPELLPPAFVAALYGELEAAFRDGALELEREGVGASGRLSVRRSDSVRYLAGGEPWLLAGAPRAALLVQWLLRRLGERLSLPGRPVFAPRQGMLARYPAPSEGYAAHLDNPGGEHDNGRTLTLVIYLNAPDAPCAGGEITLWAADASTAEPPGEVVPARGGGAALFDARAIAHQVRPVRPGPARWALALWLNDRPRQPPAVLPVPRLTLSDALRPIPDPPLPPSAALFHELDEARPGGEVVVRRVPPRRPRIGVVCTVYRGGAALDAWCEHHFAAGIDHAVLVFDRVEEPAEAADAARLRQRYPPQRLTVWAGGAVARRWAALPPHPQLDGLARHAAGGGAAWAVAARQALAASVALEAARGDELGGAPLDWLIHLDADELLAAEGPGRGGAALPEHFAAAQAAGLRLLRYVDHELLEPPRRGEAPRFKLNPHLAAARLGAVGWRETVRHLGMAQTDPRPYFRAYMNGKSAVAVAAAAAAAGVHGWALAEGDPGVVGRFLAGPSVLHFHFSSAAALRRKYLAMADAPPPPQARLFAPSPVEAEAVELIRAARRDGAGDGELRRRLEALHRRLTTFSAAEVELLEAAGLILRPRLAHPLVGRGVGERPPVR